MPPKKKYTQVEYTNALSAITTNVDFINEFFGLLGAAEKFGNKNEKCNNGTSCRLLKELKSKLIGFYPDIQDIDLSSKPNKQEYSNYLFEQFYEKLENQNPDIFDGFLRQEADSLRLEQLKIIKDILNKTDNDFKGKEERIFLISYIREKINKKNNSSGLPKKVLQLLEKYVNDGFKEDGAFYNRCFRVNNLDCNISQYRERLSNFYNNLEDGSPNNKESGLLDIFDKTKPNNLIQEAEDEFVKVDYVENIFNSPYLKTIENRVKGESMKKMLARLINLMFDSTLEDDFEIIKLADGVKIDDEFIKTDPDNIKAKLFYECLSNNLNQKKIIQLLAYTLYSAYLIKGGKMCVIDTSNKDTDNPPDDIKDLKPKPGTLDPRQFLATQKFTSFKPKEDKACFLFHGVGTGKTLTSLTIALNHLSEENKCVIPEDGQDWHEVNIGKKPLEVLVMAPQGLFLSAFKEDITNVAGGYTWNSVVKNMGQKEDSPQYEEFSCALKIDNDHYYYIKFCGYDYKQILESSMGIDCLKNVIIKNKEGKIPDEYDPISSSKGKNPKLVLEETGTVDKYEETDIKNNTGIVGKKFDVLICDEAHILISNNLKPLTETGSEQKWYYSYDTDIERKSIWYLKRNTTPVAILQDVRFLRFIVDNVTKYSIFLTGTPIQKSGEDIIKILKFLNIKEINNSNVKDLNTHYSNVMAKNAQDPVIERILKQRLFFKHFDEDLGSVNRFRGIKKAIASWCYLKCNKSPDDLCDLVFLNSIKLDDPCKPNFIIGMMPKWINKCYQDLCRIFSDEESADEISGVVDKQQLLLAFLNQGKLNNTIQEVVKKPNLNYNDLQNLKTDNVITILEAEYPGLKGLATDFASLNSIVVASSMTQLRGYGYNVDTEVEHTQRLITSLNQLQNLTLDGSNKKLGLACHEIKSKDLIISPRVNALRQISEQLAKECEGTLNFITSCIFECETFKNKIKSFNTRVKEYKTKKTLLNFDNNSIAESVKKPLDLPNYPGHTIYADYKVGVELFFRKLKKENGNEVADESATINDIGAFINELVNKVNENAAEDKKENFIECLEANINHYLLYAFVYLSYFKTLFESNDDFNESSGGGSELKLDYGTNIKFNEGPDNEFEIEFKSIETQHNRVNEKYGPKVNKFNQAINELKMCYMDKDLNYLLLNHPDKTLRNNYMKITDVFSNESELESIFTQNEKQQDEREIQIVKTDGTTTTAITNVNIDLNEDDYDTLVKKIQDKTTGISKFKLVYAGEQLNSDGFKKLKLHKGNIKLFLVEDKSPPQKPKSRPQSGITAEQLRNLRITTGRNLDPVNAPYRQAVENLAMGGSKPVADEDEPVTDEDDPVIFDMLKNNDFAEIARDLLEIELENYTRIFSSDGFLKYMINKYKKDLVNTFNSGEFAGGGKPSISDILTKFNVSTSTKEKMQEDIFKLSDDKTIDFLKNISNYEGLGLGLISKSIKNLSYFIDLIRYKIFSFFSLENGESAGGAQTANQLKDFANINNFIRSNYYNITNGNIKELIVPIMNFIFKGSVGYLFNYLAGMAGFALSLTTLICVVVVVLFFGGFLWNIVSGLVSFFALKAYGGNIYNLENIIYALSPFISIYNYDYMTKAIDQKKFYQEIIKKKGSIKEKINCDGNPLAFPKKYVQNVYFPYSDCQKNKILNDKLYNFKKYFTLGASNVKDDTDSLNLTYEMNEQLNNISCDNDFIIKEKKPTYTEETVAPLVVPEKPHRDATNYPYLRYSIPPDGWCQSHVIDKILNVLGKDGFTEPKLKKVPESLRLVSEPGNEFFSEIEQKNYAELMGDSKLYNSREADYGSAEIYDNFILHKTDNLWQIYRNILILHLGNDKLSQDEIKILNDNSDYSTDQIKSIIGKTTPTPDEAEIDQLEKYCDDNSLFIIIFNHDHYGLISPKNVNNNPSKDWPNANLIKKKALDAKQDLTRTQSQPQPQPGGNVEIQSGGLDPAMLSEVNILKTYKVNNRLDAFKLVEKLFEEPTNDEINVCSKVEEIIEVPPPDAAALGRPVISDPEYYYTPYYLLKKTDQEKDADIYNINIANSLDGFFVSKRNGQEQEAWSPMPYCGERMPKERAIYCKKPIYFPANNSTGSSLTGANNKHSLVFQSLINKLSEYNTPDIDTCFNKFKLDSDTCESLPKLKFNYTLELLKLIRTGHIWSKDGLKYHPHYKLSKRSTAGGGRRRDAMVKRAFSSLLSYPASFFNEQKATPTEDKTETKKPAATFPSYDISYYLPLVYPLTEEIMYNFAQFLTNENIKFIWMNNTFDPEELDKYVNKGKKYTAPIKKLKDGFGDDPVCVLLSPNHKEGFSFTFNPSIICLGLSNTSGDEEQIYGRILRKYNSTVFEDKYSKQIYQFISGGATKTEFVETLDMMYRVNGYEMSFRMFDNPEISVSSSSNSMELFKSVLYRPWKEFKEKLTMDEWRKFLWRNMNSLWKFKYFPKPDPGDKQAPEDKISKFDRYSMDLLEEVQIKLLFKIREFNINIFKKIAQEEEKQTGKYFDPIDLRVIRDNSGNKTVIPGTAKNISSFKTDLNADDRFKSLNCFVLSREPEEENIELFNNKQSFCILDTYFEEVSPDGEAAGGNRGGSKKKNKGRNGGSRKLRLRYRTRVLTNKNRQKNIKSLSKKLKKKYLSKN